MQRGLKIAQTTLGDSHPVTRQGIIVLGNIYSDRREYGKAELLYRRSLTMAAERPAGKDTSTVFVLIKLATVRRKEGDYEEAESLCRRALEIEEQATGSPRLNFTNLPFVLSEYAQVLRKRGQKQQAAAVQKRAQALLAEAASGKRRETVDVSDLRAK